MLHESNPTLRRVGILLATSTDGSSFTHYTDADGNRKLILTKDIPDATNGSWFGCSTPMVFISQYGQFNLFYDFLIAPLAIENAVQVAVLHAISSDGKEFIADSAYILVREGSAWHSQNILAPTALEENGNIKLWFAGSRIDPYGSGIGLAVYK